MTESITAERTVASPSRVPRRGHAAKIAAAVKALRAAGALPDWLAPAERDKRIDAWLGRSRRHNRPRNAGQVSQIGPSGATRSSRR